MSPVGILHGCGEQVHMLGWGLNRSLSVGKLGLLSCRDRGEGIYPSLRWRFRGMGVDVRWLVIEGDGIGAAGRKYVGGEEGLLLSLYI